MGGGSGELGGVRVKEIRVQKGFGEDRRRGG